MPLEPYDRRLECGRAFDSLKTLARCDECSLQSSKARKVQGLVQTKAAQRLQRCVLLIYMHREKKQSLSSTPQPCVFTFTGPSARRSKLRLHVPPGYSNTSEK